MRLDGLIEPYVQATVRYYVTLGAESRARSVTDDGSTHQDVVDVVDLPNGTIEVRIDGRLVELDAVPTGNQLSVRVDGRIIDLTTHGTPPEIDVSASGYRRRVRVESERTRLSAGTDQTTTPASATAAQKVLTSPMAGRVVKVLVGTGEVVQAGQGLLVIEAMKMENEVRARAAGTVGQIHVIAGQAVDGNTRLITFD